MRLLPFLFVITLVLPAQGQEPATETTPEATATEPAASSPPDTATEAPDLPFVHVIATGGTIAGSGYSGLQQRGAGALLAAVPALGAVARLSSEDIFNLPSSQLTPQQFFELAQAVRQRLADHPELAGVVITQGTDSLEEGAFLLDLLLDEARPVVVTGAMRAPNQLGTDGGRNLLSAVRLAVAPEARNSGVLVVLDDEVHAAREVRKTHSSALDAFVSTHGGPLGFFDGETLYLRHHPQRRLTIPTSEIEPRVDLLTITAGSDGHLVRAAVESGAQGIVLEVFGRGNVPPVMIPAIVEARQQDVVVVFTSRARAGALRAHPQWLASGLVYAHELDGLKARMVLVAALGASREPAVLQGYFDQLAGKVGAPMVEAESESETESETESEVEAR